MRCAFCNRKPNTITEYIEAAKQHEMSVEDYVRMDEGTYHKQTDLFCCTDCYIQQGMPLREQLFNVFQVIKGNVIQFVRE